MMPPVTSYDLIATFFPWTHDSRNKYSVFPDALRCILHLLVIHHLERMVFEGVQVCQRQFNHPFPLCISSAFIGGKQIIDRGQPYVFRAAFQS